MLDRRSFLQGFITTAGAMPIAGNAFAQTLVMGGHIVPFHKLVYDERYQACRDFAQEARYLGAPVHATAGDVSSLWYEDIKLLLENKPGVVAGLTSESSAHYIAALARDIEHFQVFQGSHFIADGKVLGHRLSAPASMLKHSQLLNDAQHKWPAGLARILSYYDPSAPRTSHNAQAPLSINDTQEGVERLVSWIIAPLYG